MVRVLFGVFLFFSICSKAQTCIIARIEKKKITVISDSKMSWVKYGNGSENGISDMPFGYSNTMRKIGGSGKVYFAVSGIDVIKSFEIAQALCETYDNIDTIVDRFLNNRKAWLSLFGSRVRDLNFWKYLTEFNRKPQMSFFFFGFVKRKPRLLEITLEVQEPKQTAVIGLYVTTPEVSTTMWTFTARKNELPATGIAYTKDIEDSLYLYETWKGDPTTVGERLMRKQIKGRPEIVGPPIDILVLKKNGKPIWRRLD